MERLSLDSIEWHDLVLESFAIGREGLEFKIAPYCEATQLHLSRQLVLTGADTFTASISGSLSPGDLAQLEVSTFSYELSASGRISGKIGILAGSAGYWEFAFTNAHWQLAEV